MATSNVHEDASAEVASLAENLGGVPIEIGTIGKGGRSIQVRNALGFHNLVKYEG